MFSPLYGSASIERSEFRGAPHTVATIIRAALASQQHSETRALAEYICRGLRSKDYYSEILAIYHFVISRVRYMRDPKTIELVKAPYILAADLLNGGRPQVDCDELTALLLALYLVVGCSCRIVTLAFKHAFYNGERQYSHVLIQVLEPKTKTWVTIDPVAGESTKRMQSKAVAVKIYPIG